MAKTPIKGKAEKADAYWVSPDRYVIPVAMRHITVVLDAPEKFGLTEPALRKIYKKNKEPWGHEGYAREEIMTDLIEKGWSRLRYNPKQDSWIAQVKDLETVADAMMGWAQAVKKHFKHSDVTVMDLQPDVLWQGGLDEVAKGALQKEARKVYHSPLAAFREEENPLPLTFLTSIEEYHAEKSIIDELAEHIS